MRGAFSFCMLSVISAATIFEPDKWTKSQIQTYKWILTRDSMLDAMHPSIEQSGICRIDVYIRDFLTSFTSWAKIKRSLCFVVSSSQFICSLLFRERFLCLCVCDMNRPESARNWCLSQSVDFYCACANIDHILFLKNTKQNPIPIEIYMYEQRYCALY